MTQPEGVSRRSVLLWSGSAAAVVALSELAGSAPTPPEVGTAASAALGADAAAARLPDYQRVVRRSGDQCVLTLSFWNMVPDFAFSPARFKRVRTTDSNYLVVTFGAPGAPAPMHVAEEAFSLSSPTLDGSAQQPPITPPGNEPVAAPPVQARVAGPSRLVWAIPNSVLGSTARQPLTLDTDTLLDWLGLTLSVVPNAVPPFSVRGRGAPAGIGAPRAPSGLQTAIEMPVGLIISPPARPVVGTTPSTTVFVNATDPVTHNGWTELWHTRLAVHSLVIENGVPTELVDETSRTQRTVRAVWATDPTFAQDVVGTAPSAETLVPFTTSLRYADRYDIVRLSSDFTPSSANGPYGRIGPSASGTPISQPFIPAPANVDTLMLSSLGGWLEADAHWDLPHGGGTKYDSSLLSWRHRAVQGRDAYVRVVRKGYLLPWGHRASLITVTEREPTVTGTTVGAYLRQKTFIVVGEPVKSYGAGGFMPNDGRGLPFTSVQALTLVTPDLQAPVKYLPPADQTLAELVFQPMLGGSPFLFHLRGFDWAGDPIDLRSPVLWVDDTVAYGDGLGTALMPKVLAKWSAANPTIDLQNQRVSVAEPKDPTTTGDTQLVLANFALGVDPPIAGTTPKQLVQASQPDFYPALRSLSLNMPAAATASGNPIPASLLEYEPDVYLAGGFGVPAAPGGAKVSGTNPGGVFLRRVQGSGRHAITFSGDKSGGAVTPNLGIDGYSREIGPASGDPAKLATGEFDPTTVFAGVQAKLLGGLELQAILGLVHFGDGNPDGNTKALELTTLEKQNPHRLVTTVDWHPVVVNGGPELAGVTFTIFEVQHPDGDYDIGNDETSPGNAKAMDLHAVVVTDLDNPSNSSTTVTGQIREFNINLFGNSGPTYFIQIPFDSLGFTAQSGKKTDVEVKVASQGVQFKGALSFVQDLTEYLNFGGSGLTITTSGDAIRATLTLAIPTISVGVFSLSHLAFSAGVAIPYNGDPVRFEFYLCSRENPFALNIMMFSGGGFVGLGIGVDGVELLEFSFDFGLGICIDIGVASGEISLVGGVYFESKKLTDGTQHVELTAYIKASGGISCLGLISISVELYLALQYTSPPSLLVGEAKLSIAVHIIFFGFTVGFDVHKEFAGHSDSAKQLPKAGTPYPLNSFGAVMTDDDWQMYCTAFGLLGVAGS